MSEGSPEPQAADAAVLRLRGLPFQATEEEVVEFFEDVQLEQVVLCRRNGRWRCLSFSNTALVCSVLGSYHHCCWLYGYSLDFMPVFSKLSLIPAGRATGEAYVQLGNPEDMPEALKLNKKYVGRRYIE